MSSTQSQQLLTQFTQVWRCKNLLGNKKAGYTQCGAEMLHLHRGGIEYDYCPTCQPKIDPERKYSTPAYKQEA